MAHISWPGMGSDMRIYVNDVELTVSPAGIKNEDVIRIESLMTVSVNGTVYNQSATLALSDTDITITSGSSPAGGLLKVTINYTELQPEPTTTIERSKIMTTGYKVIDFHDNNLTTTAAVTIPGIHDAIEAAYRKPLLLSGLTIAGVEKPAVFAQVMRGNNRTYEFTVYGYTLSINPSDGVAVTTAS